MGFRGLKGATYTTDDIQLPIQNYIALLFKMPIFKSFRLNRTKYEARDKQQQGRVASLEKEKNSLRDELTNTVNELTQVRVLLESVIGSPLRTGFYYFKICVPMLGALNY